MLLVVLLVLRDKYSSRTDQVKRPESAERKTDVKPSVPPSLSSSLPVAVVEKKSAWTWTWVMEVLAKNSESHVTVLFLVVV